MTRYRLYFFLSQGSIQGGYLMLETQLQYDSCTQDEPSMAGTTLVLLHVAKVQQGALLTVVTIRNDFLWVSVIVQAFAVQAGDRLGRESANRVKTVECRLFWPCMGSALIVLTASH
jgi:hypothetical protein